MNETIVLLDPPWYRLFGSHYNTIPLGIGYISSYLEQKGYNPIIYNSDFENNNKFLTQYDRVKQYERYIEILGNENHKIWSNIVDDIIKLSPQMVGISIAQPTLKSSLILAKLLKRENKHIKIVFGGPQITINPIKYDNVDHIVTGEGELVIHKCLDNSPYRVDGVTIENLDLLPFPDRKNIYFKGEYLEYNNIITGRGCPFNCTYCASRVIWKNKFRLRSIKNVIDELIDVREKYGYDHFNFRDDTFTITPQRTIDICKELKKLEITWECDTRIDNLSYDILKIMAESGCKIIRIGVESGNERILKMINKNIDKDKVRQVVRDAKSLGIKVTTYFMVGFPTETRQEIKDSIEFAKELNPNDLSLSLVTPYLGTQIKEMMVYNPNELEKYFHQSPDIIKDMENKDLIYEFYDVANKKRLVRKEYWGKTW